MILLLSLQLLATPAWTWAELEKAGAHGSHAEILEHATDIAPTGRHEAWRALVVESAKVVLQRMVPTDERQLAVVERGLVLVERYPFLESSPPFTAVRDQATFAALGRCVDDDRGTPPCQSVLAPLLARLSGKPALDAAVVMRRRHVPRAVIALVRQAVGSDRSLCREPLVEESTLAALASPTAGPEAAHARAVAFELCWAALKPAVVRGMISGESYYRHNACGPLRSKDALSELQRELCAEDGL